VPDNAFLERTNVDSDHYEVQLRGKEMAMAYATILLKEGSNYNQLHNEEVFFEALCVPPQSLAFLSACAAGLTVGASMVWSQVRLHGSRDEHKVRSQILAHRGVRARADVPLPGI
jgi:hypothetical protein